MHPEPSPSPQRPAAPDSSQPLQSSYAITEIESAINYWRSRRPGAEGVLSGQARALAEPYALMICHHRDEIDAGMLSEAAAAALGEALRAAAGAGHAPG